MTLKVSAEQHGGGDISSRVTFQGAKVRKPLLAVSGVIDKGNIVVFDGSGSFIPPGQCAGVGFPRRAFTGFKDPSRCMRKMECLSCGYGNLRKLRRRLSVAGKLLEGGPSTRLSEPGPPVRPFKEKGVGYSW